MATGVQVRSCDQHAVRPRPASGEAAPLPHETSMTDVRLRSLERVYRANTSDVGAAAAWLRERVRAGRLDQSQLKLAAYCADPAANKALDASCIKCGGLHWTEVAEKPDWIEGCAVCGFGDDALVRWVRGLEDFGHEAVVRAAVSAMSAALPIHEKSRGECCCCGSLFLIHGTGDGHAPVRACDYYKLEACECLPEPDQTVRDAVEAANAWLSCPCEEHRLAVRACMPVAHYGDGRQTIVTSDGTRWWSHACALIVWPQSSRPDERPSSIDGLRSNQAWLSHCVSEAMWFLGEMELRNVIRRSLLKWSLS